MKELAFRFKSFVDKGTLDDVIPRDCVHVFIVRDPEKTVRSWFHIMAEFPVDLLKHAQRGRDIVVYRGVVHGGSECGTGGWDGVGWRGAWAVGRGGHHGGRITVGCGAGCKLQLEGGGSWDRFGTGRGLGWAGVNTCRVVSQWVESSAEQREVRSDGVKVQGVTVWAVTW